MRNQHIIVVTTAFLGVICAAVGQDKPYLRGKEKNAIAHRILVEKRFCGSSWEDAASSCSTSCPGGIDSECPLGFRCFGGITSCDDKPIIVQTNYCGTNWAHAASSCESTCPGGIDAECPQGQSCFGGITSCHADSTTNYCGTSWGEAASSCGSTCPGGIDAECPQGQSCFGGITSCHVDSSANFCGRSWDEAVRSCERKCPGGVDNECPQGQKCFGGITSCNKYPVTPPPTIKTLQDTTSPSSVIDTLHPTSSPTIEQNSFCGLSWDDAAENCTYPCPSGIDSQCPEGMFCFPNVTPCFNDQLEKNSSKVVFEGIRNVFSIERGIIELDWFPAFMNNSETSGLAFDATYNVFVAESGYKYREALANMSVSEMVDMFENSTSREHYEVIGWNISIQSSDFGLEKSVLVTAEIDSVHSSNTLAQPVTIATSSPQIRGEVNIVGIFVPTTRLEIHFENPFSGSQHQLSFAGAVSEKAQNLKAGDFVTGYDSDLVPFVRHILSVESSNANLVELVVVEVPLEEIFDELDLSLVASISPLPTEEDSLDSNRRLFLKDIWNGFKEHVWDPVVDVIDDAFGTFYEFVKDLGQGIVDTFKLMFGNEAVRDFTLIDVEKKWEHTLLPDLVTLTGEINFEARLVVGLQVKPGKVAARSGIEAEYGCAASLIVAAQNETELLSKEWELWSGKKHRKTFNIGPVPVWVDWQPKIDLSAEAKAHAKIESEIGFSAKGDTEIYAYFDTTHDPNFYTNFEAPSFNPDYTLKLDAEVGIEASAAIIMSVDVRLYKGLLEVNAGLSLGIGMKAGVGFQTLGPRAESALLTLNDFGIDIDFEIPFSGKALYGELDLFKTNLYEKKYPIIGLPSVELGLLKEHRCLLGDSGSENLATLSIEASEGSDNAKIKNGLKSDSGRWWLYEQSPGWNIEEGSTTTMVDLVNNVITGASSPSPEGEVIFAVKPKFPPLPLHIVETVSLSDLISDTDVECTEPESCDGDYWFDELVEKLAAQFNSEIFLSQPPDQTAPKVPSTVYKFEDFMAALKKLQAAGEAFQFWLGDGCSVDSTKAAIVNIAAFLGQAMRETIIYDACDENNWDLWRADVYKEPTSPPEYLPALYPMSSGCGQLGQKYADYRCPDECPLDLGMEITGTTNAAWIGAPPPLFCGPKSKYDGLGYWNPMQLCQGPGNSCEGQPFHYPGQEAGVHVPQSEDDRFPEFFYTTPLPDANGNTPPPRSEDMFPSTNVEGCCWWGRGVIQTTGRCNFGKLNKNIGAGAGSNALYPNLDLCRNPQVICDGPSDLKWVAGIFFWVSDPQRYDRDGFNYKEAVKEFVQNGCADDPDGEGCDLLFEYASGIVNRGCHDPGETGCPDCVPGSTCDPAHNVPERVEASKQALRALMSTLGGDGGGSGGGGGGSVSNNYCGTSWAQAASSCGVSCPGGVDSECPSGMLCFGGIECS